MRQLFSILPPRMVSRKWTCQLSSGYTVPNAAATPPSAITVWALPRSDLHTIAVEAPLAWASAAARRPAPPAPITRTSKSCVSNSATALEEPGVGDRPAGHEPHVQVGDRHAEQARPR